MSSEIEFIPFEVADVVLKDGSTVRVRPAKKDDALYLINFFNNLSIETKYKRFMGFALPNIEILIPEKDGLALIAIHEDRIIAHAMYRKINNKAEVGIVVDDRFQGKGLGTILLGMITEAAYKSGVEQMEAIVLPDNLQMINVLKNLGFPYKLEIEPGYIKVIYPTSLTPEAIEVFDKRDSIAAREAVRYFLEPKSVAVIGASREKGSIGYELFKNIIEGGYTGVCYPINNKANHVMAIKSYKSIKEVNDSIDIAFITVPAKEVINVAKDCAEKGVRGLVVISSGFAEVGEEGRKLQEELLKVCRESGMRLIGPNCMGIINTDPTISLNGQFSSFKPKEGSIGFFSQSGALGISIIEYANMLDIGLSSFISVGNKADISGNDVLQYWEYDDRTKIILLYLESFGNPRKFSRIAKRISKFKPIIVVKGGRSLAGLRAAQSHTGAMIMGSNLSLDALFKQCGVIRTDTLSEMFDVASLLVTQPLPKGRKVGIITNAGGAGILAADACEANGLEVIEFPIQLKQNLKSMLLPIASINNPVDLSSQANANHYYNAIVEILKSKVVDALIVIYVPPIKTGVEEVANSILKATYEFRNYDIPIISVFLAHRGITQMLSYNGFKIPSYPFPEDAVKSLAKVVEYTEWKKKPLGKYVRPNDVDRLSAISLISKKLKEGVEWLDLEDSIKLLSYYKIPFASTMICKNVEDINRISKNLNGKFALKAGGKQIIHKTELGAIKTEVNAENLYEEALKMRELLTKKNVEVEYFVIQEMIEEGVETIVGVTHDPLFGPLVACGLGGAITELINDISVRLTPLTDLDVDGMIKSLRTYPLLMGYRGGKVYDVEALKNIIIRVGTLIEDIPEILEMDLNPVFLMQKENGAKAVDVRIRIGKVKPYVTIGAKSIR
jgi:Acyl-CoA synthetase (NDP forming)